MFCHDNTSYRDWESKPKPSPRRRPNLNTDIPKGIYSLLRVNALLFILVLNDAV